MSDLWTMYPHFGELYAGGTLICRFNPDDSRSRGLYVT